MTRLRGRAPCGERVHARTPHGHWHTTTMISSIRLDGSTACMTINSATDTEVFQTYVRQVLCPTLRPDDVVIMDNLSPHKNEQTLALIATAGAGVRFLPAYSPDLTVGARMRTVLGLDAVADWTRPRPAGRAMARTFRDQTATPSRTQKPASRQE